MDFTFRHRIFVYHIPFPALLALTFGSTSAIALAQQTHPAHHHTSATNVWHPVYTDSIATVALNPVGTRKHTDGTYTVHLRWTYATDQPIEHGKSYRVMDEFRLLDCTPLRSKPVSAHIFDAKGKPVSSYSTSAAELKYIDWSTRTPGTLNANALDATCHTILKKS